MTLLKKSLYIIAYYSLVATFSCLAFSSIIESYEKTAILPDGLSADSLRLEIHSDEQDEGKLATTAQLIDQLRAQSGQSFLLYKEVDKRFGKSFFLHEHELPISTVDWQKLSAEKPVALLDLSIKHHAIEREGKKYFSYKNKDYEVMDLFIPRESVIDFNRSFLISLDQTANILGVYDIDGLSASTVSQALTALQEDIPSLMFDLHPLQPTFKERLTHVVQDQLIIIIMLSVTIIFIGMSTIGTTMAWIDSRRDEIYARYLVGARFRDVQWWLLKEYLLVLGGSFAIGAICAFLLISSDMFNKVVTLFDGRGLITALIFCLIIGTLTLLLATWLGQFKTGITRKESS
ncbi:hypothetical protein MM221_09820 [Salipaludibacillus sp. LMS25]|jgi:ABC-type antimicrobial peptide transport system permease subunit|uniref:ABC transporter permease n=1 Tax=Salipaludibacillus sp. LMS25 TaxID=2924031 RepID=UPI0020D1B083|nr:FtsX-like permease family protein [Salipaludibacillus sp. LMS25]UTR16780.1 hypothetical protein MM221_09820 [Salipaludibacillus sp. LMS25]